jgi:hypoxanthine phosphoribosyltransferase
MASVRFPKFVEPSEISEVVYTEDQIRARVKELGAEISEAYKSIEKPLVLIGTLKGATPFFADLARELDIDCVWEFMSFSSYGMGATSSGAVQCVLDLKMDICGRDVLIVEVSQLLHQPHHCSAELFLFNLL